MNTSAFFLPLTAASLLSCLLSLPVAAAEPPAPAAQNAPASVLPLLAKHKTSLGPWEDQTGYVQAVRVGNTLYVSGSVGAGSMPEAIRQAFDTVGHTLSLNRLSFHHVVKENIFTTDLDALKANEAVRKTYYDGDYPAASWVQVSRLFDPQYVIEVEVVAVFPEGS